MTYLRISGCIFFVSNFLLFACQNKKHDNREITELKENTEEFNEIQQSDSILIDTKKCDLDFLSRQFDISYYVDYYQSIEYDYFSCSISVIVKDKKRGNTLDSIHLLGEYIGRTILEFCDDVSSFSTGFQSKHSNRMDNIFGDIVVADFNFDNRDDIAVVSSSGGNAGPLYNFYLQTKNGKFAFDEFLSSAVSYIPRVVDAKNKTLITYVHANAYQEYKTEYQLNTKTNQWSIVRQELEGQIE